MRRIVKWDCTKPGYIQKSTVERFMIIKKAASIQKVNRRGF